MHLGLASVTESNDMELANAAKTLSSRVDGILPENGAAATS